MEYIEHQGSSVNSNRLFMSRTLWLVRHGHRQDFAHPEWFENALRPYDPPLSAQGHQQAQRLATYFHNQTLDYIFCSPFLRAIQTAAPIAQIQQLPLHLENGLGEWLNPHWLKTKPETEPIAAIQRAWPHLNIYHQSLCQPHYPETEEQMQCRLQKTLEQLNQSYQGNFLLVGHSATVASVLSQLCPHLPPTAVPVASITKLVEKHMGHWYCHQLVSLAHLSP